MTTDVLDWLESLQGSGIRPGLGRIRAVLRRLGKPHLAYPSVIVAGTNGKGSTSATLASILDAAGYRAGLYTSPHLVDLRERWMIGGETISGELLEESIAALRTASAAVDIVPTYFEALTIVAFIAFQRAGCEIAVLEVGMGGRLDATNVVRPVAALITPIGFDHMEYLGTTIRKIAAEKAGVIHRGAIVLTSNRDETVLDVIRRRAARFSNPFHVVHGNPSTEAPLAGAFQKDNVALAAKAAAELAPRFPRITPEAIAHGIASTRWRGRLERIELAGKTIWIDGCHNAHAVAAVVPFIDEEVPEPRLLLFGMMRDKDVDDVAALLLPRFRRVIATEPYPPRSISAAEIVEKARALGIDAVAIPAPEEALEQVLAAEETSVFVGGSLYL
ncbi:MAG: folylpolyglutamate synthase/dihydrofolate synthase family protein, partial [Thermoanaerobaculia bacterium]